jgi:Peptidase family S41
MINKKSIAFTALLICFFNGFTQDCSCLEKLVSLESAVRENYAGFNDKVKGSNKAKYLKFKKQIFTVADTASEFNCHYLINKYISFFDDRHLSIALDWGKVNSKNVIDFFEKTPSINLDESTLKSYLDNKLSNYDKIEGIWKDSRNLYTCAIVKDSANPNIYLGVTITADNYFWRRGQIKFVFKKNPNGHYEILKHLDKYHLPIKSTVEVEPNIINIRRFGILNRIYPDTAFKHDLRKINSRLQFYVFNDTSCYLSIPSFSIYAKKNIDALIATNKQKILFAKNFIIDIRDNSGGSVYCYDSLLPLLSTNTITVSGATFFSSIENIKNYESELNDSTSGYTSKNEIKSVISTLKKNIGRQVPLWPDRAVSFDTVYKLPKNVAILINQHTTSSAELFLKAARQSKRVIVFGENSSGTVDYGDVTEVKVKCLEKSNLYLPRSRFNSTTNSPIDGVGFTPDVKIPLSVSNWISFVENYFSR